MPLNRSLKPKTSFEIQNILRKELHGQLWQGMMRHLDLELGFKLLIPGVPVVAQKVKNPASVCEDAGVIPGLDQWVKNLLLPHAVV